MYFYLSKWSKKCERRRGNSSSLTWLRSTNKLCRWIFCFGSHHTYSKREVPCVSSPVLGPCTSQGRRGDVGVFWWHRNVPDVRVAKETSTYHRWGLFYLLPEGDRCDFGLVFRRTRNKVVKTKLGCHQDPCPQEIRNLSTFFCCFHKITVGVREYLFGCPLCVCVSLGSRPRPDLSVLNRLMSFSRL